MKCVHYVKDYLLNPYHPVTVALIGCGGTGSQVLTSLGRISYALQQLGHPGLFVTAYDGDIVTEANCGRQLFSTQEIGHNKAEVLITKMNMFFGSNWEAKQKMYDNRSPIANIVISCVDSVKARLMIASHLKKNGGGVDYQNFMYWMDFGNMQDRGQVIVGTAGREHKQPDGKEEAVGRLRDITDFFDLKAVSDEESGPSCSLAAALRKQDLFINSTLAQVGCGILWKMFKGVLDVQGAYVNLDTMKVNPIKIEKYEQSVSEKKGKGSRA